MKKLIIAVGLIVTAGLVFNVVSNGKLANFISNAVTRATHLNSSEPVLTIDYSTNGFYPSAVSVYSGDTILIKNISSSPVEMESDPHAIHSDNTDLNAGTIEPGQSKKILLINKGVFGYHNDLNLSQTGKIIVQ